jgi:excinuclease ABC subunit A
MQIDKTVESTKILVKGAKEHNLRNVSVEIPRDKFVVITGLSGSGKSSLAFDTLYAEGQRRFVQCLSAYARQFLGMLKKPEVDSIEGLSPAISIEQKSISHNPRSTVGTVTEIYDYLRLLYSRAGVQHCVNDMTPVIRKNLDQIVDEIVADYSKKRIQILAPLIIGRKGHYRELFETLRKQGFTKVRIDGDIEEIIEGLQLSRYKVHNIDLVIDRLKVEKSQIHRVAESAELAMQKGDGAMLVLSEGKSGKWDEKLYSNKYSCPVCATAYEELAPNHFSFNSPYGACKTCNGLGKLRDFNEELVVPDRTMSIAKGGIAPLGKERDGWLWLQLKSFAKKFEIDIEAPIETLPEDIFQILLFGSDKEKITIEYSNNKNKKIEYKHKFTGLIPTLKHQYDSTNSGAVKKNLENYMSTLPCTDCNEGRLKPGSLHVLINKHSIYDITSKDLNSAIRFFNQLPKKLNAKQNKIAEVIIKEISDRLKFLKNVGLSYLTLDRSVRSLSGGESQRIRLASQIGSELVGIMYVLDEPSIGLHQHDNYKLINSLKNLRDLGNTVIVVEHDKAMIQESDHFIDMGPGAGVHGGEVVLSSTPQKLKKLKNGDIERSLTAKYLLNKNKIEIPEKRLEGNGKRLILIGAKGNNLQDVTLEMPLGLMVCVTGMSGSGKSTLINDTLYPILSKHFYRSHRLPLKYDKIEGLEHVEKVIDIDQSPIGRTPRSNPATYTGVFTQIRDFYTQLTEAKIRGYKSGRFSFNVKGGRCEECEGGGIKKIEMNFLPDVYIKCDTCQGRRYNLETLEVKYKDKSIADVLDMTVEEALDFFSEIPKIKKKIKTLNDVGLGYITLGQQAPSLSGGEAQRVKLASELSKISNGKTIYLLDEPTTGLHFEDIRILLKLLRKLVDKGNTVVIIEHNLDVIKFADWIIDLGPEGGSKGGQIIAEGTPEDIVKIKKSFTGKYLKEELK